MKLSKAEALQAADQNPVADPYGTTPETDAAYREGVAQGLLDWSADAAEPTTTPYGDPMRDRSGPSEGDRRYLRTSPADAWWDGYRLGRRG